MNAERHGTTVDASVSGLESILAGTLRRVQPPRGMAARLRARLQFPSRQEIAARLRDWRRLFVVFGGVMSGMLVVLTVARALFHLFVRRETL
jgi:anti-sigma factor RsiW